MGLSTVSTTSWRSGSSRIRRIGGGQQGGLAAAGRPGHQHQALAHAQQHLFQRGRKPQLRQRGRDVGMDAEHQMGAGLVVDLDGGGVDPKAVAVALDHQRVVAVGVLAPAQRGRDVRAQHGGGQVLRLARLPAGAAETG